MAKFSVLIIILYLILFYGLIHISLNPPIEYPQLKERFGTIMWHSSDKDGVFMGSYNDPEAVDHNYCYYPKPEAKTTLIIKRIDSGDCSQWYGQVAFREAVWVSEREKYNWY